MSSFLFTLFVGIAAAAQKLPEGPEAFSANIQIKAPLGAAAAVVTIRIDRYTSDKERAPVVEALKLGGYPAFLDALRKAPAVGKLEVGDRQFTIRWARQEPAPEGRVIVVVTDQPVYFVGAGSPDAKPREGYQVAIVQFTIDDIGMGKGTMVGAARVRPGNPTGVQIDDYGVTPIQLTSIAKIIS